MDRLIEHMGSVCLPARGAVLIAYYEEDMEDMLRRRDRGGSSLDDELGDVWGDLPSGYVRIVTGDECGWDGCEVYGLSVEKENSREAKIVLLAEFDSARDAERAEDDLEEVVDDGDCHDINVRQDGRRVRAEAVCDLDQFDSFSNYSDAF